MSPRVISFDLWGALITYGDREAEAAWRIREFASILPQFGHRVPQDVVRDAVLSVRRETLEHRRSTGRRPPYATKSPRARRSAWTVRCPHPSLWWVRVCPANGTEPMTVQSALGHRYWAAEGPGAFRDGHRNAARCVWPVGTFGYPRLLHMKGSITRPYRPMIAW